MRVCPSCGSAYSDERDTCPLCDVRLQDQDKTQVITIPQRRPPEWHRPCPYCGQKVLIGLDRCPWCRRPLEEETARVTPGEAAPPASMPPETAPDKKPSVYIDSRLMSFETMDTEETRVIERRGGEVFPEEAITTPLSPLEAPAMPAPEPVGPLPQGVRSPTPEAPLSADSALRPLVPPTAVRIGLVVLVFGIVFGVGLAGYWFVRRLMRSERPAPPALTQRPVAPSSKAETPGPAPPAIVNPPAMGRLIVSIQRPAQIYVDDALVATAPVAEIQVPPGTHRIRVVWLPTDKSPPPDPQEFTVEVFPGQAVNLPVTPPKPARLYVNTWPWSEVWIDGRRYGETPAVVTLPAGPHELEFRRSDGRSYRVSIELLPGKTLRVGYDFTSGQLWQNPPPSAASSPGVDRSGEPE
ncbi:MAG: PEGA domain-containing protein [Acidobacteria bacterium]|nr:PEGA domain-containing protein [Acidobacteriota bacterium]MDW7983077.1 PEGA domain-containing protein [Acidobacteriota bacterium]